MARPNARSILTYKRLVSPRHQPTSYKRLPWRLQHERDNVGMCCAHAVNVWWPCGTIQHTSKGWAQICNMCATMMRLAAFKCHKRLAKHWQWTPVYDPYELVTHLSLIKNLLLNFQKAQCTTVLPQSFILVTEFRDSVTQSRAWTSNTWSTSGCIKHWKRSLSRNPSVSYMKHLCKQSNT